MAGMIDSASNINEYQEYFLWGKGGQCLGLTTLLRFCADCPEIREPSGPVMGLLYLGIKFSRLKLEEAGFTETIVHFCQPACIQHSMP
jgi:hypothetical protein